MLAQIASRRPQIIDLSLNRVIAALGRLGDPHHRLPPVFHIAGTNGKGSTGAFLRAMLEASGQRIHAYTSPHLVRFNERIVLAGEEISDAALVDALNRVDAAMGEDKLTYFETATAAAFLAFSETPADYLILEVGLGGRLDATNVLPAPLCAIVSPVDLDHQQFLGDRIEQIAAEKAGIFRPDAPAVIGRQEPGAMAALLDCAAQTGARTFVFGQDWDAYAERGRLVYQDDAGLLDLDPPRLAGLHQFDNAGLAIAALRASNVEISQTEISAGLAQARWPARLQRLTSGPLIEQCKARLGQEPEIWLDGGHNPHAGRAVARAMADMEARSPRPLVLIAGMQANKDAAGFFENFTGLASEVYCTAADHSGVAAPDEVALAATKAGLRAKQCKDVEAAMSAACKTGRDAPPRILICGSLYLAGEILRENA